MYSGDLWVTCMRCVHVRECEFCMCQVCVCANVQEAQARHMACELYIRIDGAGGEGVADGEAV